MKGVLKLVCEDVRVSIFLTVRRLLNGFFSTRFPASAAWFVPFAAPNGIYRDVKTAIMKAMFPRATSRIDVGTGLAISNG